MRLRAKVIRATGTTIQRRATIVGGVLVPSEQLPVPVKVEIDEAQTGFFLFHYDEAGRCIADTWHATLTEAKQQATFEFGIEETDWVEIMN